MPGITHGWLDAASNRADLIIDIELTDDATGDLVPLDGAVITMMICDPADTQRAIVTASTADGRVTIAGPGVATIAIPPEIMSTLCAGEHPTFIRVAIGGVTTQLFAGSLPIIDGGPA